MQVALAYDFQLENEILRPLDMLATRIWILCSIPTPTPCKCDQNHTSQF